MALDSSYTRRRQFRSRCVCSRALRSHSLALSPTDIVFEFRMHCNSVNTLSRSERESINTYIQTRLRASRESNVDAM